MNIFIFTTISISMILILSVLLVIIDSCYSNKEKPKNIISPNRAFIYDFLGATNCTYNTYYINSSFNLANHIDIRKNILIINVDCCCIICICDNSPAEFKVFYSWVKKYLIEHFSNYCVCKDTKDYSLVLQNKMYEEDKITILICPRGIIV